MKHRTRLERAEQLGVAAVALGQGQPLRQVATELGVARSTLRDWCAAVPFVGLPAEVAACLATPAGARWLHRLVVVMHLIITLRAGAGVRLVCEFLELSGLSSVVGASYGSQYAVTVQVQEAVAKQAQEQRAALAAGMPPQAVALCEDETFHPEICLVAIEPVSNFILLEQYALDRTAATWTQALETALAGLPVTVSQVTSDEAKALRHHQEQDLRAPHAADLFHGQHEVSKGTSLHLARQVRQASAAVAAAQAPLDAARAAQRAYDAQVPHPRGRPPAFTARIDAALTDLVAAEAEQTQALARQAQAREQIRELGILYHPYDLERGQVQSVAQVAARFADVWARLTRLAAAADLPTRAREHLAKAQRLTVQWLASLAFFWASVQTRVDALDLAPDVEQAVLTQLIPALYLERVAGRSTHTETRHRLHALSAQLLEPLRQPTHPLQALAPATRQHIEVVAAGCADLFQRSSSCVEGRNGHLSRYHHGGHRLSGRKLAALTALHNFYVRRPDGTTAAERFFGRAHLALFDQVLAQVSLPPPARRRRPRPAKQPYLTLVAA
ncbi:DUF6399 domain-containing protein [uncultured Thiodictyon sp.]|uniref:DUF6399 domain-containing protein n=1 Tax=uncultured Thiodictyon sp. TaxID=1846217 RepID=UPI0025F3FCA3|nr:DUF6399 domain-containing protein [uncultured Thiodictyon sp.]